MNDAAFWDKIAPKYAQDPIKDLPAYEYTLERTKSYLTQDSRVVELGCGTGSTALLLAPHVREIRGSDVSPGMISIAQNKARSAGVANATFTAQPALGALTGVGSVDVVLGFNLFHLLPKAEDVFGQIHAALPKGGYFISKTPCLGDKSLGLKRLAFKVMIPPMQWIGKAPFVRSFTHSDLEGAIKFAGFDIIEAGNFPSMSRYIVARRT